MDSAAVDAVREVNRTVSRRLGGLQRGHLGRDRSLGASGVLWEIGTESRRVRDLRAAPDPVSGYLRRLLRSLVEPLDDERRARLVEAMTAVRRLLTAGLVDRRGALCRAAVAPAATSGAPGQRGGC